VLKKKGKRTTQKFFRTGSEQEVKDGAQGGPKSSQISGGPMGLKKSVVGGGLRKFSNPIKEHDCHGGRGREGVQRERRAAFKKKGGGR